MGHEGLENKYIENAKNVSIYRKTYEKDMELSNGVAYQKRERILSYIERNRKSVLHREYLQNCWMHYVAEVFEVFESMEKEQYQVLEKLADKDAIEEGYIHKKKE